MSELPPTPEFEFVPADGNTLSADDEFAIPAIDDSFGVDVDDEDEGVSIPFGRSWQFDHDAQRFVLLGGTPATTSDIATLIGRMSNILSTARLAHPIFSDDIGMEDPHSLIGFVLTAEREADWQTQIIEALSVIDRITSIENFTFTPLDDIVYVSFDFEIDNEQTATLNNLPLVF